VKSHVSRANPLPALGKWIALYFLATATHHATVGRHPSRDASGLRTAGASVGGDWCDAFVQGEGHTLVIGDVAGHDATAARAMICLRRLLRRVAADTAHGAGSAELLTAVDKAMTTQGVGVLTTGIVARLTRLPDAHAWLLRWSNAGHPPPVLVHGDGLVSTLETPPGRPLGIGADCPALRPSWSFNLERP
jgi:serine phosphatase RsbU (regulator of sigma subunit)